jgi:hypothetical protein
MTAEHPKPPARPNPDDEFGLTEQEQLYNRVSDARFRAFLDDEQTTIHRLEESSNSYGEFLFVTVSRMAGDQRRLVTFYGLGEHEHRERWYVDEWFYYRAHPFPDVLEQQVDREKAEKLIQRRRDDIAPYVDQRPQSGRGKLFEMIADLTDDDGAIAEMDDLGDLADWLADGLE